MFPSICHCRYVHSSRASHRQLCGCFKRNTGGRHTRHSPGCHHHHFHRHHHHHNLRRSSSSSWLWWKAAKFQYHAGTEFAYVRFCFTRCIFWHFLDECVNFHYDHLLSDGRAFELVQSNLLKVNNLSQPFHSLREAFGDNFLQVEIFWEYWKIYLLLYFLKYLFCLQRFRGAFVSSGAEILDELVIIDTPGTLDGDGIDRFLFCFVSSFRKIGK